MTKWPIEFFIAFGAIGEIEKVVAKFVGLISLVSC